jgi:hypothetical protein
LIDAAGFDAAAPQEERWASRPTQADRLV